MATFVWMDNMTTNWKSYEEVAAYLLNRNAQEFGLDNFQGKQTVHGRRSGTDYEIDAKGIRTGREGFVIVECRRYTTSKQNQERMGALAYRIIDAGADGGILVSPLGIQEGAAKIARAENIFNVQLDANSTSSEFAMRFLNKLMVGVELRACAGLGISEETLRTCRTCGKRFKVVENETACPACTDKGCSPVGTTGNA